MENIIKNLDKDLSCDFLIVGSGAGGSVAASELSAKGKDCILVEEGDYFEIDHFKGSTKNSFLKVWRNSGFTPIIGNPNIAFGEGMCLGGSTFINGGLIWRTPKHVLETWERENKIEGYNLKNLESHFKKIETNLHVRTENNLDGLNKDSQIIYDKAIEKNLKALFVPRANKHCFRHNNCSTGCSSKGKISVLDGYLKDLKNKIRIIVNAKARKILTSGNKVKFINIFNKKNNKTYKISFNKLIVACGATQTPQLLRKSFGGIVGNTNMKIHLNLRIGAKYKESIDSYKGTIFTTQIQEFLKEGAIFMSSNFNKSLFASANSKMSSEEMQSFLRDEDKLTNFVLQVAPKSHVEINNYFDVPFLQFKLSDADLMMIKKHLLFFSCFLFDCGFKQIILPLQKGYKFNSHEAVKERIEKIKKNELEMISVHGMSSVPISKDKYYFFDNNGQSRKFDNLYCVDASVLPSNIGESPQGTIMAFAHEIMDRMN